MADRPTLPDALLDRMAAVMAARWRELAAAKVEDSPEGHCADLARVAAAALLDGCQLEERWGYRVHYDRGRNPWWTDAPHADMGWMDSREYAARMVAEAGDWPRTLLRRLVLTTPAEPEERADAHD